MAALAAGLVLAPVALGLFGAGARGSDMIQAFRTVETRSTVTALQNDFSSLTIGQGSLCASSCRQRSGRPYRQ